MPNTTVPADGEAMPKATVFLAMTPSLRTTLATTIENLIALLDEIDGEVDAEPSLGWNLQGQLGDTDDREDDAGDNREEENEHGGDINDEPHDWNELEPNLGWSETCGQGPKIGGPRHDPAVQALDMAPDPNDVTISNATSAAGPLGFDGKGYREGQEMLRDLRRRRPDIHQEHVRVMAGYGW